ncbi:MAG: hypothetical protein RIQ52_26 [Pseudomonadota bacterium]
MKAPVRQRVRPVARASGSTLRDRFSGYLSQHRTCAQEALGRIMHSPYAASLTIAVIAIVLALPASFQLGINNLRHITEAVESGYQLSVFLKPEINADIARRLSEKVRNQPHVVDVRVVSKEQGLEQLQHYSGLGDALKTLNFNPLPIVIKISLQDRLRYHQDVERLVAQLRDLQETDLVQDDQQMNDRLRAWLHLAERSTEALGLLLGLGVLLVVGNTIRLEMYSRREEIQVQRFLGATDGYIRRPFLYTAFWYGLIGSMGAIFLVLILLLLVYGPARQLSALYGGDLQLVFLGLPDFLILVLLACSVSVMAAWTVLTHYLLQISAE